MLNHVRISLIIIGIGVGLTSCDLFRSHSEDKLIKISEKVIGTKNYDLIYKMISDTVDTWVLNKILSVEAEATYPYKIDSLLCFNKNADRFITCRHLYINVPGATSDDLRFYYGEKINNQWYFFSAASIVIPRKMARKKDFSTPLSYQEMHEIALKEVYGPYLTSSGEINEEWFTNQFEHVGWCDTCKTKEDFQKSRVEDVAIRWLQRDTTQPIKRLEKTKTVLP